MLTMDLIKKAVQDINKSEKDWWKNAPKPGLFMGQLVADTDKAKQDWDAAISNNPTDGGA